MALQPHDWDRITRISRNGLFTGVDGNGNGIIDGSDVILAFSDGVEDDGNGVTDDLVGADFATGVVAADGSIDLRRAGHDTNDTECAPNAHVDSPRGE